MIPDAINLIPHRGALLFVDKIVTLVAGQQATGEWRPSDNPWLASNPASAILLPTLCLEAVAQLGACAVFALERYRGRTPQLAGFENVRFPSRFSLEDVIHLSVEIMMLGSRFGKARGSATIGLCTVCQGEMRFLLL